MIVGSAQLQTVIKVKKYLEKKTQQELVTIQKERSEQSQVLDELQQINNTMLDEAMQTLKTRATELQARRAFLQALRHQIENQEQKVRDIEESEDTKREELVETTQSKKVVEKLQERRVAEILKEQERKEQSLIDVLAQRIHSDK